MLKKLFMYGMMKARPKKKLPLYALESRHHQPELPNFNDSTYFFGRNDDGFAMVARLGFRNNRAPEFWYAIKIPSLGTFRLDTLEGESQGGFQYGAMHFECIEPGKKWEYKYDGPIFKEGQNHHIKMHLTFKATKPVFNFDEGAVDAWSMSETLAKEDWNREFFQKLKEIRQMHYEQVGEIDGFLEIDGQKHEVNLRSIRLHSSGQRVWRTWNRHIWFAGVLDNGEAFNISRIRYDFLNFDLSAGFITSGESYTALKDCDNFETFAGRYIPKNFSINFEIPQNPPKTLKVYTEDFFPFSMEKGIYQIREGIARFELDGVQGIGIAEFGLNPQQYDIKTYRLMNLKEKTTAVNG